MATSRSTARPAFGSFEDAPGRSTPAARREEVRPPALRTLPLVRHLRAVLFLATKGAQYRRWSSTGYLPWSERRFERALRMIRAGRL